ncbi:DUF4339 domain-containing protein [Capnocytophaga sp. ARDL2]|uniref:DUF4339 domain-containing protein n=1 Tax=Capnocytophaga sp. ARDL2 TaxID=3238809 RepID=UPI003558142F
MKIYYYEQNGKQQGPVAKEDLRGNIRSTTLVWTEGMADWVEAKEIDELKELFSTPPPLKNGKSKSNIQVLFEKNKNLIVICSTMVVLFFIGIAIFNSTTNENEILKRKQQDLIKSKYDLVKENEELIEQISEIDKEKEEQARLEIETKREKDYVKKNWRDYIETEYGRPEIDFTFGGISSFSVSATNKSKYYFDKVVFNVIYIKKDGDVYKKEKVTLKNIPPQSTETTQTPKSNRGTKVLVQISQVVCKEIELDEKIIQ